MAKNNSINLDITENADGFDLAGGTTERKLTLTGADITLTGSGSNTFTYPSASDTLVGRASTDTLTNKTINTASNTITVVASDVSDFDTEVSNNTSVSTNTTHSSSDGTDHANVVTNDAKVSFTKSEIKGVINHGGTAGTTRPTGFDSVEWIGTIEPDNAVNDDTWIDTT